MPTLRAPAELQVALRRGIVRLRGEDRGDLEFDAVPSLVAIHQDGAELGLECRDPRQVDLTVRMPRELQTLQVDVAQGRVEMRDLTGEMTVEVANGSVSGRKLAGELQVDAGHADVVVDGMDGELQIDTALGSIEVIRHRGPYALDAGAGSVHLADAVGEGEVETGTGGIVLMDVGGHVAVESGLGSIDVHNARDLRLQLTGGMGPVQITGGRLLNLEASLSRGNLRVDQSRIEGGDVEVASGNAHLQLDGRQGGRLEAFAHHGRVVSELPRVRLPFAGAPTPGERVVLTFDDGPQVLSVRTRRGSITVLRGRQDAAPLASAQERERGRRLILEELRAGRITTATARRLLSAIDNSGVS
jgi:hypothetical protein